MDSLKSHYNAIAAGVIALPLGYLVKKSTGMSSVSTKDLESILTSFVVIGASVMLREYALKEVEKN